MATRAEKIRVGVFTAVAAGLIALMIAFFGGLRFWKGGVRYYVVYDDSVYGLEDGANVYLNGVRVGSVERITVSPDDPRKVVVRIRVRRGTPVRTDTRAVMAMTGITGLKVIDLREGSALAQPLPPGSTIPASEAGLDKLQRQANQLADQTIALLERASKLLDNLVAITNPKHFEGLDQVVNQARQSTEHLSVTTRTLREIVEENRATIETSLDAVRRTATTASSLMDRQVTQLVSNTNELVQHIRGLVRDNEGSLRAAMFDLRQASRSVKELARELRQRPSRLFFSNAPPERKRP